MLRYVKKSNIIIFSESFYSYINTWNVVRTLEKVPNHSTPLLVILNFFSCSPNIPHIYKRVQRHGLTRVTVELLDNIN